LKKRNRKAAPEEAASEADVARQAILVSTEAGVASEATLGPTQPTTLLVPLDPPGPSASEAGVASENAGAASMKPLTIPASWAIPSEIFDKEKALSSAMPLVAQEVLQFSRSRRFAEEVLLEAANEALEAAGCTQTWDIESHAPIDPKALVASAVASAANGQDKWFASEASSAQSSKDVKRHCVKCCRRMFETKMAECEHSILAECSQRQEEAVMPDKDPSFVPGTTHEETQVFTETARVLEFGSSCKSQEVAARSYGIEQDKLNWAKDPEGKPMQCYKISELVFLDHWEEQRFI